MSKQIQLPSPGRIVDFTWGGGSGPAIVLSNSGDVCALQVFSEANGVLKRTNVPYSEEKADHTWCWPEKVTGTFDYEKPEAPQAEAPAADAKKEDSKKKKVDKE